MTRYEIPYDDRSGVGGHISTRPDGAWIELDFTTGAGHQCNGHDLTRVQAEALLEALTELRTGA